MRLPLYNRTDRFFHLKIKGRAKLSGETEEMVVNLFVGGYFDLRPWLDKYDDFELSIVDGAPPPPLH